MSATAETVERPKPRPELHSGDKMTQAEFHRIYTQMDESFRAELIGGIVYVASPLKLPHGQHHMFLGMLVSFYCAQTPGTDVGDSVTTILGEESEPQPDLFVRILPEFGGRSRTTDDDYIEGPPELLIEVASSSVSLDLHGKRQEYALAGVPEYLVLNLRDSRLHWFDLRNDQVRQPDADGICRMTTFPGLWLHENAVCQRDYAKATSALNAGLSSPEHAAFVAELASRRK
jgi:Uma2 family endonuclease